MEVSDHDRKVGFLLGLDPAEIPVPDSATASYSTPTTAELAGAHDAHHRQAQPFLDRRAEEEADPKGIPPLSRERIKEFSAFSAEISDEEFDEYMAFINAERGRTA